MKALVITSESPSRTLLCEALARRGHEVIILEDLQAACAFCDVEPPEMIWLGVNGATAEGPQLVGRLRAVLDRRPCAIVALAENLSAGLLERLLEAGADDCLILPLDERQVELRVMVICTDVTKQRRAEQAIRREQELLQQLLELHERDRQVIAFELHDGFAQQLTGAMFNFQAFRELQEHNAETAWKAFDAGLRLIGQCIDESRRLVSGLCPPVLEEFGIIPAVENLIAGRNEFGGPEIELVCRGHFPRLARPLENAVFRIVQETLANACRHSQSERVRVELFREDPWFHICIEDWGAGFDPQKVSENRFGLRGVRERARLLGGSAMIDSAPGKGTRVRVTLPLLVRAEEEGRPPEEHWEVGCPEDDAPCAAPDGPFYPAGGPFRTADGEA